MYICGDIYHFLPLWNKRDSCNLPNIKDQYLSHISLLPTQTITELEGAIMERMVECTWIGSSLFWRSMKCMLFWHQILTKSLTKLTCEGLFILKYPKMHSKSQFIILIIYAWLTVIEWVIFLFQIVFFLKQWIYICFSMMIYFLFFDNQVGY